MGLRRLFVLSLFSLLIWFWLVIGLPCVAPLYLVVPGPVSSRDAGKLFVVLRCVVMLYGVQPGHAEEIICHPREFHGRPR